MNAVAKRFKGKLGELKPLAGKLPKIQVRQLVNEAFCIEFIEPQPARPFVYVSDGDPWYIRPEDRQGTSKQYWVMRKTIGGHRVTKYLAPVGELTGEIIKIKISEATNKAK